MRLLNPGRRVLIIGLSAVIVIVAAVGVWRGAAVDDGMTATVRRGPLTSTLTLAGILKPAESVTYRSPLGGRETEVVFLAPEGTRVNEGDLIARLETTEVERELQRTAQELRQAQVDLQVADIEVQEANANIASLEKGEGALSVDEARTRLDLAQKKVDRLREEHEQLKPLMEKGFITRDEIKRTSDELEQAEEELALSKRRSEILLEQTRPRDKQRAVLQLAQREAQRENVRARLQEVAARGQTLQDQLDACSMYARRPGMVVYEEYLGTSPRRKIRVGDRVTGSQVLVTIPEVTRMLVDAAASEADVHRLAIGQTADIRLEAFPDLRLTGKVIRIGTLARSDDRPSEDKRFDVTIEVNASSAELRPEMTARVDILTAERSDVLLVPVNAVFDQQGAPVSHVITRTGVETRPVQLGESNQSAVEVVAGLAEGERVALIDMRAPGAEIPRRGETTGGGSLTPAAPAPAKVPNQGNMLAPR